MAQKVLVVDDEKLIVKGIRFSLEQDGMEVDCAYLFVLVPKSQDSHRHQNLVRDPVQASQDFLLGHIHVPY